MLCAGGCRTARTGVYYGTFAFDYEGRSYEIVSVGTAAEGGRNYLVRREGEHLLLRARDADQNGTLDTLLIGALPLDRANAIYARGLAQAQAEGRYRQQQPARAYTLVLDTGWYTIRSHRLNADTWYNRFILFEVGDREETIVLDTDADGVLDEVVYGVCDLAVCQERYKHVLQEGIRTGRVEHVGDRYVVRLTMQEGERGNESD